jgi:16S rRNA (uracil1498-N3)-methyltransferase
MSRRLRVEPDRLVAGRLLLEGGDAHYLARVLRLVAGHELEQFDGTRRTAPARVLSADGSRGMVELDVGEPVTDDHATPRLPLVLVASVLKGDRMDLVLQKATELGVTGIRPAIATRSVVRLGERRTSRHDRWHRIVIEAARQCGRSDVPALAQTVTFAEALTHLPPGGWRVLFHEGTTDGAFRDLCPPAADNVVVAVGPEGGFTEDEVDAARAVGFQVASLGPRVLRAETAALVAVVLAARQLGDLG